MIQFAGRRCAGIVMLAMCALLAAAPLRAEDFYEQQLRIGKADVAANRNLQAVDELRIAAFGFLDRPVLLVESLARLALVQNTLNRSADLIQTLNRFVEVERSFSVYSLAALEADTRARFEALLLSHVPARDIAAVPGLSKLVRTDAQKVSDLPPDRRQSAYEQGVRRSPRDIAWPLAAAQNAAATGQDQDVILWSRRALSIDSTNPTARVLLVHALTRRNDCRNALTTLASFSRAEIDADPDLAGDQLVCLVAENRWSEAEALKVPESVQSRADVARAMKSIAGRRTTAAQPTTNPQPRQQPSQSTPTQPQGQPATPSRPVTTAQPQATASATALARAKALVNSSRFPEAQKTLTPAVAADPSNRALRLALLEAAMLSGDWRTAVSQIGPLGRFVAGEEASMFYAASALYELGRHEEARPLMQRASPRLPDTPLVAYYKQRILGTSRR